MNDGPEAVQFGPGVAVQAPPTQYCVGDEQGVYAKGVVPKVLHI